MPALPEVREDAAPPEIAAAYAALREGIGIPLVNLIYRHLATLPGVLPWLLDAARPVFAGGQLAGARDRLAATIPLPPLAPLTVEQRAGLPLPVLIAMAETYNRGNLSNLILLTALRHRLEGIAASAPPPPAAAIGAAPPPLPDLPRLADLPPDVAALVLALAARHGVAPDGAIPSLYLHLALWPAALRALPDWLAPMLEPAHIAAARDTAIALAAREAAALAPLLGPLPPLPGEAAAATLTGLRNFTTRMIPAMVPIGLGLARVLG